MKKAIIAAAVIAATSVGCTRIGTGETGLRVEWDKQINPNELQPGSFKQTIIGDVLVFPVRDIKVNLDDLKPQDADNTTLSDFDITVIYNINPNSVGEIYSTKSRGFHAYDSDGTFLMYEYVKTLARTAAYKAVRKYPSLKVADNRDSIQDDIIKLIVEALTQDKLEKDINIHQVQVRNVQPNLTILQTATEAVAAQNQLKTKQTEVEIARKEAERIALLNNNKGAVEYMGAMANMKIAEAVAAGKVQTIILPYDFKGMVSVK